MDERGSAPITLEADSKRERSHERGLSRRY